MLKWMRDISQCRSALCIIAAAVIFSSVLPVGIILRASYFGDRWNYVTSRHMQKESVGFSWEVDWSDAAFLSLDEKESRLGVADILCCSRVVAGWPTKCVSREESIRYGDVTSGSREGGYRRLDPDYLRSNVWTYKINIKAFVANLLGVGVVAGACWCGGIHLANRVRKARAEWRARKESACLSCGYSLLGIDRRKCPECGHERPSGESSSRTEK